MPDNNQTQDGPVEGMARDESTSSTANEPVQSKMGSTGPATGPKYVVWSGLIGPTAPVKDGLDWDLYYQSLLTTPTGTHYIGPTDPPPPGPTGPLGPLGSKPGQGGYVNLDSDLRESEIWKLYQKEPFGSSKKQECAKRLEEEASKKITQDKRNIAEKHVMQEARGLLKAGKLDTLLIPEKQIYSFVLSIDIRRSTDLMLQSTDPESFANFLMTLCKFLQETIFKYYGVYEKFTGDGVLAFFPATISGEHAGFSGEHAGYYAICAAEEAHQQFRDYYRKFRSLFKAVLLDVGLGIGIDYGKISITYPNDTLSIVGLPVVYACRMSGAPAGMTYLNEQAYDEISRKPYLRSLYIKEAAIEIKHQGSLLAYPVIHNKLEFSGLKKPDWTTLIETPTVPEEM